MMNNKLLSKLTGQWHIYKQIQENSDFSKRFLIQAPSGSGKHYLIGMLNRYYSANPYLQVVQLCTDYDGVKYNQDYAPFLIMLAQNEDILYSNLIETGKNFAAIIPKIGDVLSRVLNQKKIYPSIFNNSETEILMRFERIIRTNKIVFLCEAIDNWDSCSLSFLSKLFSFYSHNRNWEFICTSSEDIRSSTHLNFHEVFSLNTIPKSQTAEAISAILPTMQIDPNTISRIYDLSNGNIGLLVEICKLIKSNGTSMIDDSDEYRSITLKKLQGTLIESRFQLVVNLLNRASLIGERSYKRLLQLFTAYKQVDFSESIRISTDNHILSDDIDSVKFVDSFVWRAFRDENMSNKQFHYELANCIKHLMPSMFEYIADELVCAGEDQEAAIYYILSALHEYHTYRVMPILPPNKLRLIKHYKLFEAYQSIAELYTCYFSGDLNTVVHSPNTLQDSRLSFEADYIKALAYINGSLTQSSISIAINLLDGWIEDKTFQEESPFQWMRAAILVLGAQNELYNHSSHSLIKEIEIVKRQYLPYDKGIEHLEYYFLARCNYCYTIDVAYIYTKQAVKYYEKRIRELPSLYPFLVALVNSAANALVMGNYDESIHYSSSALTIANDFQYLSFGIEDALINNYFLAAMLRGDIQGSQQFDEVMLKMTQLIETSKNDVITNILLQNNAAIMLCYNGNLSLAAQKMHNLSDHIKYNDGIDDYYRYIIECNDCVLDYMKNGVFNEKRFLKLCSLKPLPHDQSYFSARNNCILEKALSFNVFDLSRNGWNDLGAQCVGPAWSFWGKWLIFSDLQIWSD
jgi:hypothetical protein